ncbi:MAG: fluoride efflux transporter CrcB [Gammaproteobacteria bacterium]|nr:fluoride efflux transporter CrcB [Gammaproteobacteria bacterium]
MHSFGQLLAVALGGALGASLRWALTLWLPAAQFPWPVLVANLSGSFAIGMVWAAAEGAVLPAAVRLFLVTGLLGALTTFSTFSLDVVYLLQHQRWLAAGGFMAANVVGCVFLTYVAFNIGRRLFV